MISTDRDEMTRVLREARLYLGEGGIDVGGILRHMSPVPYAIRSRISSARELGYAEHAFRCLESAKAPRQ